MSKEYIKAKQQEVDKNFSALNNLLDRGEVKIENLGLYALMRNEKIIETFTTWEDANKAGNISFKDKLFSIQEITQHNSDLGFFSYAGV